MVTIRKTTAACELSKYSQDTLDHAAAVASACGAELTIVNVINRRDLDTLLRVTEGAFDREIERYIQRTAKDHVETEKTQRGRETDRMIAKMPRAEIPVRKIIKVGHPVEGLLTTIDEQKQDLLVMGRRGRGDVAGSLFGSVVEKMLRSCPIRILSVRRSEQSSAVRRASPPASPASR